MAQQRSIRDFFSQPSRPVDVPDASFLPSPKKLCLPPNPKRNIMAEAAVVPEDPFSDVTCSFSSLVTRHPAEEPQRGNVLIVSETGPNEMPPYDASQRSPTEKSRLLPKSSPRNDPDFEESDRDDDGIIPLPSKEKFSSENPAFLSTLPNTRHGRFEKIPKVPLVETKFHLNKSSVFPKQTSGRNRNRSVQHKWFQQFDWLHYNVQDDCLLCFTCIKASSMIGKEGSSWYSDAEMAFLVIGFRNWKDALTKFTAHEKSIFHKKSSDLILKRTTAVPVHSQLNEALLKEQKYARTCLLAIISSIRFLALSGNAVRGHEHHEGNLHDLLIERKQDIPELETWMKKRNNFLSSDMQNEHLQIMSNAVLRDIITGIKSSPYFAIIADGTTDISGKEQLSICLRSVHPISLQVSEMFVGLYNADDSRGSTIAAAIKDVLLRMNLPISDLRGVCFDGAANMSGRHRGVQRILRSEQPKSIYVHCGNHSADLALQEIARQRNGLCHLLCLVKDSCNIILASAKRKKKFDDVVLPACSTNEGVEPQRSKRLVALCPTRWCVRVKSLVRYKAEYLRIQVVLEEILADVDVCITSDEKKSAIRGWLKRLYKFETLFYLNVSIELFSPCEDLARALQCPQKTTTGARRAVNILIDNLARMRCEEFFDDIFNRTIAKSNKMGLNPPKQPRRKCPPPRYEQDINVAVAAQLDPKTAHRKEFFEILDLLIAELRERFDQQGLDILVLLEELLLDAIKGVVPDTADVRRKLGPFAGDFDEIRLKSQLHQLSGIFPDPPMSTSTLAAALEGECTTVRTMLQEVVKLVVLLMTIPASVASAERSFSALRRLKSYRRSTMTQKRLTHLMILHVHKELTSKLDLMEVMREFVSRSNDRKRIFGKV